MSFVKNLSQYNQGQSQFKPPSSPDASQQVKIPDHPAAESDDEEDEMGDADECCEVNIPVAKFKSNNIKRRGTNAVESESPEEDEDQQTPMKQINIVNHCICGNLCTGANTSCSKCLGLDSLHLEGEIWKKQKKASTLKSYWFVLLGRELYSYKSQGDSKHKEMRALSGVYIKDEPQEFDDSGVVLYPFMLIFPNKRRIYYFYKSEEKARWMNAIKQVIGYSNLYDFYECGEVLGKGKYGVVKKAIHKRTRQDVAVKIVKKRDLNLKDLELLKREIEVIKVLQHPSIIRFYDIFEDQDYIQIVMELLMGGDLFSYLHQRKFIVSEARARVIAHQIATAVYFMHSFGVAHRDLKPENILMMSKEEDSEIKLVDFGLTKTFGPGETCKEPYGTLCYVAPEILMQKPYDKAVDCWSLGVIIYMLLGRHLPFDSQDDKEIGQKTIL